MEADEDAKQAFVESLKNEKKENIVYVDETGFDEHLYREYAFSKRGQRVIAKIPGKKLKRLSLVAALCNGKILAPFGYSGTGDSNVFHTWVEKVLLPQLKPGQIIIMDNAKIHKSEKTKELIKSVGCELRFLPPYSPDLNPIEHTWASIKQKIRSIIDDFVSIDRALAYIFS